MHISLSMLSATPGNSISGQRRSSTIPTGHIGDISSTTSKIASIEALPQSSTQSQPATSTISCPAKLENYGGENTKKGVSMPQGRILQKKSQSQQNTRQHECSPISPLRVTRISFKPTAVECRTMPHPGGGAPVSSVHSFRPRTRTTTMIFY